MTYPVAIGFGCAVSGAMPPLCAAEWSLAPTFSVSLDEDSNRALVAHPQASGGAALNVDLIAKRATENLQVFLEPRLRLQRFSDSHEYPALDDRELDTGLNWITEHNNLLVTASIADQSTLTTELTETGLVSGDTRRRTGLAALSWSDLLTDRNSLVFQFNYSDVAYSGQFAFLLLGYRYPSVSIGDRFDISQRSNITFSAFGDELISAFSAENSHEVGGRAEFKTDFSERTHLDVAAGASARTLLGVSSTGTIASLSLSHDMSLGSIALTYARNLVPYGTGVLVERQQWSLVGTRGLTERLSLDAALLRIDNNQTAVLLRLDRRSYDQATVGLNWRSSATWKLRAELGALKTQQFGTTAPVHEVRGALTVTWTPRPSVRSF